MTRVREGYFQYFIVITLARDLHVIMVEFA